jgi:GntR family transcriptional repressor for pyruvate dehydrogenase complex
MTESGSTRETEPEAGLTKQRVAERVLDELRAYIEREQLKPGDRLPPERVFMELFSTGRSSLREALRILSALGTIEVIHGDGMYVAARPLHTVESAKAIFDAREEHALRNLVETRLGIELAAVTALTQRGTAEDFANLAALLDQHDARLAGHSDEPWSPLEFELTVAAMSGNTWLQEIEQLLRDAWLDLSAGLRTTVNRHSEWCAEHRAILASMRSGNIAQAQRLVMAHLSLERFEEDLATARPSRPRRR